MTEQQLLHGIAAGGVSPFAPPSPWHQHVGGGGPSTSARAVHRLLAETTQSSSIYHQPEGGILSGHGVLDDTLSLFMVQVCVVGFFGGGVERERERDGSDVGLTDWQTGVHTPPSSQYAWPAHHPHNPSTTNTPNQHQTVIIITVTRLLSLGTKFLKQPRVIMEVVGGILLGACVFGWLVGWLVGCFTHAGGWMRTKDGIGIPLASHDKAHNTRPHQPTHSLTD